MASTSMVGLENTNAGLPKSNLWLARASANTAVGPPGDRRNRYPTHKTTPNNKMNPCTTSAHITASNPPSKVYKMVMAVTPTTTDSRRHPVMLAMVSANKYTTNAILEKEPTTKAPEE